MIKPKLAIESLQKLKASNGKRFSPPKECSWVLTGRYLDRMRQPSVYIRMRGGICLYVGQSINGIFRLGNHHVIDAKEKLEPYDEIIFYYRQSHESLDVLEQYYIQLLRPVHNIVNNN